MIAVPVAAREALHAVQRTYPGRVQGLRRWLGRRPMLLDASLATLWVVVLALDVIADGGALGLALLVITASPIVIRRRRPVAAFAGVVLLGLATYPLLTVPPLFPLILTLVALRTVSVRVRGRVLAAAVAAAAGEFALVITTAIAGTGAGPDSQPAPLWGSLALGAALLAAVVLLGVNNRVRRAHLAALEDRARRAETERDLDTRIAVAAERARIAGEMHDIVAHSLTVMITLSDGLAARASTAGRQPGDAPALRAVSETGRQALTEMRRLLGLLSEPDEGSSTRVDAAADGAARAPLPGAGDLDALLERVRAAGLPVTLTRQGDLGDLGPGTGLTVYRIVQEALTNTLKHAGPDARAHVTVRGTAEHLSVEISDDGLGQPATSAATGHGHGLTGMRERAACYGGTLEAGPAVPAGWRIHVVLPTDRPLSGAAQ